MNVVLVSNAYSPVTGGVEKAVAEVARELARRRHHVEVVTARNPIWLKGHELVAGIPVHRLPFYVYRDSLKSAAAMAIGMPLACRRLRRLVGARMPCVVHVHFIYHNAVCVELLRRRFHAMGVPIVVTLHGGDAPNIPESYRAKHRSESRILDWAAIRLLRHADAVTAVSVERQALAEASGAQLGSKLAVIRNGVNEAVFMPAERRDEAPVILAVGRLAYEKGFDVLIEAFAEVARAHAGWELHIAGGGVLEAPLRADVAARGLSGRVRFLGSLSERELVQAFRSAGVIASSSRWEGFSLAMLEAMSCGKALVTTETGGVRELVEDGVNGVVVPREDSRSLATALTRLMRDGPLRARLGAAARASVAGRFSWSTAADAYEAVYSRVLGQAVPHFGPGLDERTA